MKSLNGFTLIEVIIATALSAGLFLALLAFLGSGLSGAYRWEKTIRESLSSQSLEQMIAELKTDSSLRVLDIANLPTNIETGALFQSTSSDMPYVFIGSENGYQYCTGSSLSRLVVSRGYSPDSETAAVGAYSIRWNQVFSGSVAMVGTKYAGDTLGTPLETELSSPSTLAQSGSIFLIADTGNNRVLMYENGSLSELVKPTDGIIHPKSLAFEGNAILIGADNGLYQVRPGSGDGGQVQYNWTVPKDITFDSIVFTFDGIAAISGPSWSGSFSFPIWGADDTVSKSWNALTYAFSWTKNIASGSVFPFSIESISPALTANGTYTFNASFRNGWSEIYSETFPYFTKGDVPYSGLGRIIERTDSSNAWKIVNSSTYSTGSVNMDGFLNSVGTVSSKSVYPVENVRVSRNGNTLTLQYAEYAPYDCQAEKHTKTERIHTFSLQ